MDANRDHIRLLLVDDEEEFLHATSRALGRRGIEVSVAPNGVTALEKVFNEPFDIVVLDVKMPDIDGLEVFGQISNRLPKMPVILLTGHPSINDAFRTSKNGLASYMAKPVEMDELAETVRETVMKAKQRASKEKEADDASGGDEKIRVMIVDDEQELLSSLTRVFVRRDMDPFTADSGASALEILENTLVDVMVLDVKMPGMSGLEVLKMVKERYPSIQVILLSGHPSIEAAVEGIKAGASDYLKKPPDIEELVASIVRLHREHKEIMKEQQRKMIQDIKRRYPE